MKIIFCLGLVLLVGCGKIENTFKGTASIFSISGGEETADYPALQIIDIKRKDGRTAGCSGTFISKTTLLTAAHCLADAEYVSLRNGERATEFLSNDLYTSGKRGVHKIAEDLAVVKFPYSKDRQIAEIGKQDDSKTSAEVIGFGLDEFTVPPDKTKFGIKRIGRVQIEERKQGTYCTRTEGEKPTTAFPLPGDSGGALLRSGTIIAVSSTIFIRKSATRVEVMPGGGQKTTLQILDGAAGYVDLHSQKSLAFFEKADAKGFELPLSQFEGETILEGPADIFCGFNVNSPALVVFPE